MTKDRVRADKDSKMQKLRGNSSHEAMLLKISRELVESKVKAYSFKGLDTRNTNIAPSKMLPQGEFYRTALSDCIYHSVS